MFAVVANSEQTENIGEERRQGEGGNSRKLLILLVELRGIDPMTSWLPVSKFGHFENIQKPSEATYPADIKRG